MKPVTEMTPVELLYEFHRDCDYMNAVAQARAQGGPTRGDTPGRDMWMEWRRPGKPWTEVRVPFPQQDERWKALCDEINRRFER